MPALSACASGKRQRAPPSSKPGAPVAVGLLHATCGGGALPGGLGGQLLAGGFASCGLAGCLLRAGHGAGSAAASLLIKHNSQAWLSTGLLSFESISSGTNTGPQQSWLSKRGSASPEQALAQACQSPSEAVQHLAASPNTGLLACLQVSATGCRHHPLPRSTQARASPSTHDSQRARPGAGDVACSAGVQWLITCFKA